MFGIAAYVSAFNTAVANAVISPTLSAVAYASAHMTMPVSRSLTYGANEIWRNLMPDIGALFRAFFAGKLTYEQLQFSLGFLGVDLPDKDAEDTSGRQEMWKAVMGSNVPIIDLQTAWQLRVRRMMSDEDYNEVLSRNGLLGSKWEQYTWAKATPLSVDIITACLHRGLIDAAEASRQLQAIGYGNDRDREILLAQPSPLPVSSLIDLLNRGTINEEEVDRQLRASGFGIQQDRERLISLRRQLPSAGDVISVASQDTWSEDTVKKLGLDDEYSPAINVRLAMLGILPDDGITLPDGSRVAAIDWAKQQWRMHWQPIAPSTAVELFHRFRGNPNNPNTWSEEGVRPFTADDLELAFFRAGIPSGYREWITAAAFPPLQRRQIGTLFAAGVLTSEQALSKYQDAGFNEANSRLMVQADTNRRNQNLFRILGHESVSDILHAYEIGTMGRDQAAVSLYRIINAVPVENVSEIISPTRQEITDAYNEPYIQNALASIDHKSETKLANTRIAVVRRQYLRGQLNIPQANARLIQMGIRGDRAASYTALWAAEATLRGKELPASHALKLMRKGLITSDQAAARLLTLGYPQGDVIEMIALTSLDIANDKAKAKQLMARDVAAQQRAHAAAIRAQQQKLKQQQSNLARSASKADLVKWYTLQILPRNVVVRRLEAIGVSPPDVMALLAAADQKASAKSGKGKQQSGTTNGTTGT